MSKISTLRLGDRTIQASNGTQIWGVFFSGPPKYVTEILADIFQKCCGKERAGGCRRRSFPRNTIPNHVQMDETRGDAERVKPFFFFTVRLDHALQPCCNNCIDTQGPWGALFH